TGDVRFGTLSARALHGRKQEDIFMDPDYDAVFQRGARGSHGPNMFFIPDVVLLDTPQFKGRQLFYQEQTANFVPFDKESTRTDRLPAELIGMTNQQMWKRYGLAFGGAPAPADAVRQPRIHGLLGKPISYPPKLVVEQAQTRQLQHYPIMARAPGSDA